MSRKRQKRAKKRNLEIISSVIISLLLSLLICIALFISLTKHVLMSGNSMSPTIKDKEHVLGWKNYEEIKRFDLVFVKFGEELTVSRVIALPSETAYYLNDVLYINDEPVDEKFIIPEINKKETDEEMYTENMEFIKMTKSSNIPEDYYLLLGDNRPSATDSRHYGLISKSRIKGKVNWIIDEK